MPSVVSNDASVDGQFMPVTGHLFPQDVAAVFEVERPRVPDAAGIDRRDAAAQHLRAEPDAPRVGRQLHVHARARTQGTRRVHAGPVHAEIDEHDVVAGAKGHADAVDDRRGEARVEATVDYRVRHVRVL